MTLIIGLLVALASGSFTWHLVSPAVANLPSPLAGEVVMLLVGLASVAGFLAGSALCRRARRSREYLTLFGVLAFGVAGGMIGAAYAIAMTFAYTHEYAGSPGAPMDIVLTALAYPVLGALGFALGATGASLCGLVAAGALRFVSPATR